MSSTGECAVCLVDVVADHVPGRPRFVAVLLSAAWLVPDFEG
jgi:hypothetical protein